MMCCDFISSKTIKTVLLCFSLFLFAGCKDEVEVLPSSIEGIVGKGDVGGGISGVKVVLVDPTGNESDQVAVTDKKGKFKFESLYQKRYSISIQKDGLRQLWLIYGPTWHEIEDHPGGYSVHGNEITIENNKSMVLRIVVVDNNGHDNDEISIRDYYGNPISEIEVPDGASTIAIWLYNATGASKYWYVLYDRDFPILSVYPESGTLQNGSSIPVTFYIDPDVYTLVSSYFYTSVHINGKVFTLWFNTSRKLAR